MLSAVGLALDLAGAVALTLGLYRHSRYLYPGLARAPDDVAQDAAFGTVGVLFLALGFVLQGLQYVGVTVETSHAWAAASAGVTILLALLVGWLAFGLIYIARYRRERSWVDDSLPEVSLRPSRRVPGGSHGWRFWRHKYDV
jgi:NhaP-type Na+/H+ or K+/H+ antiporter